MSENPNSLNPQPETANDPQPETTGGKLTAEQFAGRISEAKIFSSIPAAIDVFV